MGVVINADAGAEQDVRVSDHRDERQVFLFFADEICTGGDGSVGFAFFEDAGPHDGGGGERKWFLIRG